MIRTQKWSEVEDILATGKSIVETSLQTGVSVTSIYRFLKNKETFTFSRSQESNNLNLFQEYIKRRLREITNLTKLYKELKEQGYIGSYQTLYRYVNELPQKSTTLPRSIRVESGPGEQAQVDWGHFGEIEINGTLKKLYCFVYILSYSRALYIEFTTKQNVQSLEDCHIHAFEQLGIPKIIVYDNMKTVVIRRQKLPNGEDKIYLNPAFSEFSKFYDFDIQPCSPYWPRAKGKVEAGVKYVRNNLMQGEGFKKTFNSIEELNEKANLWLDTIANVREHKTTGEKPIVRWLREKQYLRFPNNYPKFQTSTFFSRSCTKDGMVLCHSNYYSVPIKFARKRVLVKEFQEYGISQIEIYYQNELIAHHTLSPKRNEWIIKDEHLLEKGSRSFEMKSSDNEISLKKFSIKIEARPLSYYKQFIPEARNVQEN